MKVEAVVFDLFQTLVRLDGEEGRRQYQRLAERVGADPELFAEVWIAARPRRETGPLLDNVREVAVALGLADADVDALVELRREGARATLVPRAGAVETLDELRRRGFRLGLISNCSGDVPDVWDETPLAAHFDATVFSCDVGATKPERRVYEAAWERLGVAPGACLFVDDQPAFARGARDAGMDAVLIDPPDGPYEDVDWDGPRISSPPELLDLLT